jgi:HlyD family secretion protein
LIWISLIVLAATVLTSRVQTTWVGKNWVDQIRSQVNGVHRTTLPARIDPGSQVDVLGEFTARVSRVLVTAGTRVEAGETLAILENPEITGQVEGARKRLNAAFAHIDTARASERLARYQELHDEQVRRAVRERDAAAERLRTFTPAWAQREADLAGKRTAELRPLVQRGLATDAELEIQRTREQNAVRELESAHEHLSRLKQELEQAESQLRLLQIQPDRPVEDSASAAADYADASAALSVAQERARRLVITAPTSGTLIEIPLHEGDWIPAGARVARIVDLSTLKLLAPVSATIARSIVVGQDVTVRVPTEPPTETRASVSGVTLVPDAAQKAYLIQVSIPNPNPKTIMVGLEARIEFDHSVTPAGIEPQGLP